MKNIVRMIFTVLRTLNTLRPKRRSANWKIAAMAAAFSFMATAPIAAGVNPDGSYSHSVPIGLPPGTSGVMPKLSLDYNSRGGNGIVGVGWQLSGLPTITRMNWGKGIKYNTSDTYAGPAGRLVDVSGNKSIYHAATENWGKYVPSGNCGGGPCSWTLYDNMGNKLYFGTTSDSRIKKVGSTAVRVWALAKLQDRHGNHYTVNYSEDTANGDYYPTLITYTKGNGLASYRTVAFSYESRKDYAIDTAGGTTNVMNKRLRWITVRSAGSLVRKYRLDYQYGTATGRSRLTAVQEYGRNGTSTLPKQTFAWREGTDREFGAAKYNAPRTSGNFKEYAAHMADVNGDGMADAVFTADYDGGLRVYAALATGNGKFGAAKYNAPRTSGNFKEYAAHMADVNGDGMADAVFTADYNGGLRVYAALSTGNGKFGEAKYNAPRTSGNFSGYQAHMADVNGDGMADAVFTADYDGGLRVYAALATGGGRFGAAKWNGPKDSGNFSSYQAHMADVNGDGMADAVFTADYDGGLRVYAALRTGNIPDLLKTANSGLGGTTNIAYQAATDKNDWRTENAILPAVTTCGTGSGAACGHANASPRQLVIYMSTSDGRGSSMATRYSYKNGRVYSGTVKDSANLGFQEVREYSHNSSGTNISNNRSYYRQVKPYHGRVSEKRTYTAAGVLINQVVHNTPSQYWCKETGCSTSGNQDTHSRQIRGGAVNIYNRNKSTGSVLFRVKKRQYDYDKYGNARWAYDAAYNSSGGLISAIYNRTYYINRLSGPRAVGLAYESRGCTNSSCANIIKRSRKYYDSTGLGSAGSRLLPTKTETWKGGSLWATTTRTFDAHGNVKSETAANGLTTSYTYDSTFRRHKKSVTSAAGHTTTTSVDHRYGVPTSVTDANGLTVTTTLDTFGRPATKLWKSGGTTLRKQTYSLGTGSPGSNGLWTKTCDHYGSGFDSKGCTTKYRDAMGRIYKVVSPGGNGGNIQVIKEFDANGRVRRVSTPHASGASTYWTYKYYDAAGRVIRIKHTDGKNSYMAYNDAGQASGSVTMETFTDAKGHKTRRWKNEKGKVVKITQALGTSQAASVNYNYDAAGRVASVTGPTGATVSMTYDAGGRKKSVTDPNSGTTSYTYYDSIPGQPGYGAVKTETRPSSNGTSGTVTRTRQYDSMGRLWKETSSDGSVATFLYNESDMSYSKGRMTTAKSTADGLTVTNRYAYDILGNVAHTYKTVAGTVDGQSVNYTVAYSKTKDNMGRDNNVTYPDGAVANISYNGAGKATSIVMGGVTYAAFSDYDARGKVGKVTFGNGAVTNFSYQASTGLLSSLSTVNGGNTLMNNSYVFDDVGNVASITNHRDSSLTMNYSYDALDRLTNAARGDGKTFTYGFDLAGNLTNKSALDANGNVVQRTRTFQTGTHRITNDGARNNITYTAAGNMLNKGAWNYQYNHNNMLKVVKENGVVKVRNYYDHKGQRVMKVYYKDTNTRFRTYYMGGGYQVREKWVGNTMSASQATKYIMGLDGGRLASVTSGDSLAAYNKKNHYRQQLTMAGMLSSADILALAKKAYFYVSGFAAWSGTPVWTARVIFFVLLPLMLVFVYLRFTLRLRFSRNAHANAWWKRWSPSIHPIWRRIDDLGEGVPGAVRMGPWLSHAAILLLFTVTVMTGCAPGGGGGAAGDILGIAGTHKGMIYGGKTAALTGDTSMGLPIGTYFYHGDHLGSASVVTDATGTETTRIVYLPYGEVDHAKSPGEDTVTHKFTGQEFDPESQLYYYNARYYDASLGVFTSADKVVPDASSTQGYNRYMYVKGNPIKYTDPSGHSWLSKTYKKVKKAIKKVAKIALAVVSIFVPVVALVYAAYLAYEGYKNGGWKGALAGIVSGVLQAYNIPISVSYSHQGGWGVGVSYGGSNGLGVSVGYSQNGGWNAGVSYGVNGKNSTSTFSANYSQSGGWSMDASVSHRAVAAFTPQGMGQMIGAVARGGMGGSDNGGYACGYGKMGECSARDVQSIQPAQIDGADHLYIMVFKDGSRAALLGGFGGDTNGAGFSTDVKDYLQTAAGFGGSDRDLIAFGKLAGALGKGYTHSNGTWRAGNHMSTVRAHAGSAVITGLAPPTGTPTSGFNSVVIHTDDPVVLGSPSRSIFARAKWINQTFKASNVLAIPGNTGTFMGMGNHSSDLYFNNALFVGPRQ